MTSLFCGAVIVLSLGAGRAGAQIDSNSVVKLWCGPVEEGCSMTVTVVSVHNYDTVETYGLSYNVSATDSGTFLLKNLEVAGCLDPNTPMTIDTVRHVIRGLSFYQTVDGDEAGGLCVQFDSIPYEDSSGFLNAHGKFSATYDLWEEYTSGQELEAQGGCGSYGTLTDSVNIEIRPANLSVTPSNVVTVDHPLAIEILGRELIILSRIMPSTNGRFEVMDMLGRTIILQALKPDEREININVLPPGCYLARLGNQVAKFMVPPS